jgi:hypothetical protein
MRVCQHGITYDKACRSHHLEFQIKGEAVGIHINHRNFGSIESMLGVGERSSHRPFQPNLRATAQAHNHTPRAVIGWGLGGWDKFVHVQAING